MTLTAVGNAVHGNVGLGQQNDVVFVPEAGFTGRARFDYTVTDAGGTQSTSTAYVTVVGPLPTDPYFQSQWHLDAINATARDEVTGMYNRSILHTNMTYF